MKNKMSKERKERMPEQDSSLSIVLNRVAFSWEDREQPLTIEEILITRVREEAQDKLGTLNTRLVLNSQSVVDKVRPRAESWQISNLLKPFEGDEVMSLETFLEFLKAKTAEAETESDFWVINTLSYEARAALRRQIAVQEEKERLSREVLAFKINKLKKEPDQQYGDVFNKLVCQMADKMEIEGGIFDGSKGRLIEAEQAIREQITNELNDQDIEEYLTEKTRRQLETRLRNYFRTGMAKLQDERKASTFASLMFEIDSHKTNEVWQGRKKKLEDVIARGLNGEMVNLVTLLCTINKYDFNGHYTLVPDIFAYQETNDQQLDPIPLIINELAQVVKFFQSYGINAPMTIYVSDVDYTESKQCGPVTEDNLHNLQLYLQNLKDYLVSQNYPMSVMFISEATQNNSAYEESKARIWEKVSTMKDLKFLKEWGRAFEEDLLKRIESQRKRKFFPESDIEVKTLEMIKRIWSVNGAQGTFFGTLPGNTVLVSTERRERDQNYVIDDETRDQFIPVLYILHAADNWTRNIAQA